METNVDTVCLISGEKVTPLLQCNVDMLSEALPDPPTLIDGDGRGL